MAFTVNGPKWKQVRLEGQPGYWIQVDDNDSPIDLDEEGNIRVYSSKTDKNPQFGRIKQISGIQREQDDKVAADRARRQADERAMNSGAWKFANAISYAPYIAALPMAAEVAPAFAPGSAFWMNPITQRMVAGTAMSKGFDAATKLFTGYNSWSEGMSDLVHTATGWNPNNSWWGQFLTEATNPGWMMNPSRIMNPIGKIGEAVETGLNKATSFYNSPLTGKWTTIGSRQYRLSPAAGANRIAVESGTPTIGNTTDKVVFPVRDRTGKSGFTPIMESDIPTYMELLTSGKATEMINPRTGQTVRMYKVGNRQPIREDELRQLLEKYNPPISEEEFNNPMLTEAAKSELKKAQKLYKKIGDTYSEGIEDIKAQTEQDYGSSINWDWYNGGILSQSNIPAKVATSPVFDPRYEKIIDSRPIMQRFYENVLNKDGIIQKTQKELIDKGILIPYEGRWLYQPFGKNYKELVDPTRVILNHILEKEIGSVNRIPYIRLPDQLSNTFIPYHSTPVGDASITRLYARPTRTRPLFASIDDGMPGFSPLTMAYRKSKFGTSIPVMTRGKLPEEDILEAVNGLHGSNNFGEVGELMSHFQSNGGKPQMVKSVSDARNIRGNTGQRQNELNFGTGTPDVGFLLNTWDLEYPSSIVGPFQGYKKGGRLTINNNQIL